MARPASSLGTLLLFFAAVAAVAALGAQFTPGAWYSALDKPSWTPPSAIFAPVWTLLYAAMAVAGWRIWRVESARRQAAMALFWSQLLLNGLWSWLFFGLHAIGWALLDLAVLWLVVGATTWLFFRLDRWAGMLFIPYFLWSGYALALNAAIWWLAR